MQGKPKADFIEEAKRILEEARKSSKIERPARTGLFGDEAGNGIL